MSVVLLFLSRHKYVCHIKWHYYYFYICHNLSPLFHPRTQIHNTFMRITDTCLNSSSSYVSSYFQGDIFSGLNDGILSRAEALAAVDMQKHQTHSQMSTQLKHDVMSYHHGMAAPPQRPLQVSKRLFCNYTLIRHGNSWEVQEELYYYRCKRRS